MKVKSLFLSMFAIAALVSCSKSEDIVAPAGSEAAEAKATLKLEGDGVGTRVPGDLEDATESGASIKNITVFFFNATDFIVGKPQYITADKLNNPIKTNTDAAEIVVIANLSSDLIASTFKNVSSLSQLKAIDFSSIAEGKVNQSEENLYSSGSGEIRFTESVGVATVQLHFVSARVKTVKISWNANQNYAASEQVLKDDKTKWFAIKQVYMMTAQTNSPLIPDNTTDASWGGFTPQTYAFAGGVAWGTAPWTWVDDGGITTPTQTNDYLVTSMPTATGDAITNVLGTGGALKAWYMFENPAVSGHQTGLIIEVLWRSKENSENTNDILTRYFTVYFGEKKQGADGGIQPLLKAGNTYGMAIGLKGDFKPGGNAGGGGDEPSKPSVDATVTVTVTPAKWTTTAEISKDFQ